MAISMSTHWVQWHASGAQQQEMHNKNKCITRKRAQHELNNKKSTTRIKKHEEGHNNNKKGTKTTLHANIFQSLRKFTSNIRLDPIKFWRQPVFYLFASIKESESFCILIVFIWGTKSFLFQDVGDFLRSFLVSGIQSRKTFLSKKLHSNIYWESRLFFNFF